MELSNSSALKDGPESRQKRERLQPDELPRQAERLVHVNANRLAVVAGDGEVREQVTTQLVRVGNEPDVDGIEVGFRRLAECKSLAEQAKEQRPDGAQIADGRFR